VRGQGATPMSSLRFRLLFYAGLLVAVMLVGIAGTMLAEGFSLLNAFYFTIVTVATVGYGDVHPATTAGKCVAMFVIVMGVGTFLGVIANATELMLARRERQTRLEKLNMVIGVFFSEVGTRLLRLFAPAGPALTDLRQQLLVTGQWADEDFARLSQRLKQAEPSVDFAQVELLRLSALLLGHRSLLVSLLGNPALLEHEAFTDLLWAVFHLAEELACRDDLAALPDTDQAHLANDMNRAYRATVLQWLDYMHHLKSRYPYLFSLAVRTNPFDQDASPLVRS
jgi:hypothetical protein